MNKSFMIFLGIGVMAALIGIATGGSGEEALSSISYTVMTICGAVALLVLVNPNFFRSLNVYGVAWLVSGIGFGILAFYLNKMGNQEGKTDEYGTMTLVFATVASLSIISAIGQGFYPNSRRSCSLLTIAFNLTLYIPITWIVIHGSNAPLAMFTAPIADQIINVVPQEIGVIDALIKIVISIAKLQPVYINGTLPFPHLILIIHLGWNFLKVMRSYSWWFIGSSFLMPFLAVAWVKHIPIAMHLIAFIMGLVTLAALGILIYCLCKHWKNEVAS